LLWRKVVRPQLQARQQESKTTLEAVRVQQETADAVEVRLSKDEQQQARKASQRMNADVMTQRIRDMSDNDPRIVALVIRQWMSNDHE
ncbi:TPA: flagellar M-ring protein FliF, partial [Pluralibacter gergoviae]|nr:flagellar M-ring protein FliF [Pluralibacter gergoviae]HDS1267163.1 flagellar M-ring protein FliF [Pluralibacter gergoviae]HDS1272679.1 flagellar M-ring protein FliF [Pluralibacter gergoviae]HDS1288528.1 flagellar M-ring protein FliF [Pluralibacter gergoviae]